MKIFIPFARKDIGGTKTFFQNLSFALTARGISVSNQFSKDFDTLFIIADCPLRNVLYAKIFGKNIIQRLDGVYHRATPAGWLYPLYNLKMKLIHRFFADQVIYQSIFSQKSSEKFLGKTRAKTHLIYNGTDTKKISLCRNTTIQSKVRLVTFAKFRRMDQIVPLIESVKLLDPEKFSFDIYGSYTENLEIFFKNLPKNISFLGKKENDELLALLNQYHIFLFSDQSACPNSVLEAMAAGLPVVAYNRGSIPEIVTDGMDGYIIDTIDHDVFSNAYPFDSTKYEHFSKMIIKASSMIDQMSTLARDTIAKRFDIKKMTQEYIRVFKLTRLNRYG